MASTRIVKAKEFIADLQGWKNSCESPENLISDKLWFDLQAMVHGLEQAIFIKMTTFPGSLLKPVTYIRTYLRTFSAKFKGVQDKTRTQTTIYIVE